MKYLIAIFLLCLPALAATKYPAYTDNANSTTFAGGATNFATVANLGSLSNSIPAGTNIATLNGTNVFTGTNRFTGNVIITNAASTISGNGAGLTNLNASSLAAGTVPDARISSTFATAANLTTVSNTVTSQGNTLATNTASLNGTNVFTGTNIFTPANLFPPNMIGRRLLWSSPTNYYFSTIVTNAGSLTNAGDFKSLTALASATIPPLLGKNSHVVISFTRWTTNSNAGAAQMNVFIGPNTNFVGCNNQIMPSATIGRTSFLNVGLIHAGNSWTQQFGGATFQTAAQFIKQPTNYCDMSVSNTIYLGLFTTSSHLGLNFAGLAIYEDYAP
jgi:hypothetical protein